MTGLWSETVDSQRGLLRLTPIHNRRVDELFSIEMNKMGAIRPDQKILTALHTLCVYRARLEARGA